MNGLMGRPRLASSSPWEDANTANVSDAQKRSNINAPENGAFILYRPNDEREDFFSSLPYILIASGQKKRFLA